MSPAQGLGRRLAPALLIAVTMLAACRNLYDEPAGPISPPPPPPVPATFAIPDEALPSPLVFIAYGDMRFTAPSETEASRPEARRALIEQVAAEQPAAVFLNGDLPWHGVDADYLVYRDETRPWRQRHLRVFPALGNHEFSQCAEAQCLERWWTAFPELRGRRWYSVALGSRVLAVALDSDAPLLPGSEQRQWLEQQLAALSPKVRVVLIVLHHPPVAEPLKGGTGDHGPRPNEEALVDYLTLVSAHSPARIVVSAGHIHNYERFDRAGVMYLVSGGGGARPYEVERSAADLYRGPDFPNFHYLRFELRETTLVAAMFRLKLSADGAPAGFERADRFELSLQP